MSSAPPLPNTTSFSTAIDGAFVTLCADARSIAGAAAMMPAVSRKYRLEIRRMSLSLLRRSVADLLTVAPGCSRDREIGGSKPRAPCSIAVPRRVPRRRKAFHHWAFGNGPHKFGGLSASGGGYLSAPDRRAGRGARVAGGGGESARGAESRSHPCPGGRE